uniref:Mitochondrial rRNA methyltransferase 1 homolog (S. cerevisiae) n=1 Tax=Sinocyclocheilus rhinocerous TaxID=307959 RepID=A0A673MPX4_9TELE
CLSSINMLLLEMRFPDQQQQHRRETCHRNKHLEIVFGVASCLLALMQSRRKPSRLFMKNSEGPQRDTVLRVCQESVKRGVQIQRVHQGLCLQASPLGFITEEKTITSHEVKNHRALWLVLDGVQDPMNLGAILRSAYFLGVDRIASSIHNSCPLTPTVSKATGHGGVKAEEGWQVVGTVGLEECSPEFTVMPCSDFKMSRPTLLLMGGEGDGLSPELSQMCDVLLTIPPRRNLHPGVESLSVSVATGMFIQISLFTFRRQVLNV